MRRWSQLLSVVLCTLMLAACTGQSVTVELPDAYATDAAPAAPTATSAAHGTQPTSQPAGEFRGGVYTNPEGAGSLPASDMLGPENTVIFRTTNRTGDTLVLNLVDVPAPAEGKVYQGWIVRDDGTRISAGVLTVTGNAIQHDWVSPDGENLLAVTRGFNITEEAAGGGAAGSSTAPGGRVVFGGEFSDAGAARAVAIFFSNTGEPATPRRAPFGPTLLTQMDLAVQHSQNALNANAIGAANETLVHLEHIINILEGSNGERFKDYNGDGRTENPGDGFGVLGYAQTLSDLLDDEEAARTAEKLAGEIKTWQDQITAVLDKNTNAPTLQQLHDTGQRIYDETALALYHLAEETAAIIPITSTP